MDVTLFVLNRNFDRISTISSFTSLIWTERYSAYGDFELKVIFTKEMFDLLKIGYYILLPDSDQIMIVETIDINFDPADISKRILTISGRDGSSILTRRVNASPQYQGTWNGGYGGCISELVRYQFDTVTTPQRQVPWFVCQHPGALGGTGYIYPSDDNNVYTTVKEACDVKGLGFKVEFRDDTKHMVFIVYEGKDRSYEQYSYPPVIFSSEFENLGAARYRFNTQEYKTIVYAQGPDHTDEGIADRTLLEVGAMDVTGIERREMAIEVTSDIPDEITAAAMQEIAKLNVIEAMDCELDPVRQFVYGRDFFLGDIVQVVTDFGVDAKARVIEFTRCWDENGYTEVPTFDILEAE